MGRHGRSKYGRGKKATQSVGLEKLSVEPESPTVGTPTLRFVYEPNPETALMCLVFVRLSRDAIGSLATFNEVRRFSRNLPPRQGSCSTAMLGDIISTAGIVKVMSSKHPDRHTWFEQLDELVRAKFNELHAFRVDQHNCLGCRHEIDYWLALSLIMLVLNKPGDMSAFDRIELEKGLAIINAFPQSFHAWPLAL